MNASGDNLDMHCLNGEAHKETNVGLNNGGVSYVSILDLERSSIVDSRSLKGGSNGDTFSGELSK